MAIVARSAQQQIRPSCLPFSRQIGSASRISRRAQFAKRQRFSCFPPATTAANCAKVAKAANFRQFVVFDMTTDTPRRKRIVLCRGQYCNMGRRADKLYPHLEKLVDEINGDQYPKPVKLEIANCLSMCGAGPNLMIYPDGVACNGVEENMLEEIVDHYVRE